jgi:hypothetical protein
MDSENAIIPFCLYSNDKNSYIGLPEKINNNQFNCPLHENMKLVTVFYGINPDVKPNPTHATLLCIKNANKETIDITSLYDPFNRDIKCTRFLAWLDPTPGTIELFISKNGDNMYISPNKNLPQGYVPHEIPSIYVLPSQKVTFSNSYGKCVPDPSSKLTLGECIVLYNKNITRPEYIGKYPNILTYLKIRYGDGKKSSISSIAGIIAATILSIAVIVLFWLKIKKLRQ